MYEKNIEIMNVCIMKAASATLYTRTAVNFEIMLYICVGKITKTCKLLRDSSDEIKEVQRKVNPKPSPTDFYSRTRIARCVSSNSIPFG